MEMAQFAQFAESVIAFVRDHKEWAAPIVFILAFGESMAFVSLVLPFWGMLVALGALVTSAGLNWWWIWVAASVGAALGDWVSYWLGYHYHAQLQRAWPMNRFPDLIPKGHAFFEKWGVWAIVLGRFSGPFRASVPIVAGIMEMPWLTFQIANWLSAFLWAGVLLSPGTLLSRWVPF